VVDAAWDGNQRSGKDAKLQNLNRILVVPVLLLGLADLARADLLVLSGGVTTSVRRYDDSGTLVSSFVPSQTTLPAGMTVGPDGRIYVSGSDGVDRYDARTGTFVDRFISASDGFSGLHPLFGPDGRFYTVNSSSGGFFFPTLSWQVNRYDGQTGTALDSLGGWSSPPNGLAFGPKGGLYFAVTDVGPTSIGQLDIKSGLSQGGVVTGPELSPFPGSLAFGPDGQLYVANTDGNNILRYNVTTGAFEGVFVEDVQSPQEAVFGPDGNLYVIDVSRNILRYDGQTGAFLDTFVPNPDGTFLWNMTFAPAAGPAEAPEPSSLILGCLGVVGFLSCCLGGRTRNLTAGPSHAG
jgi:streptogramin lyase